MLDRGPLVSISGEVERRASLTAAELESLVDTELMADFHCREGWSRRGLGCFQSVKSVDRIELTREPVEATGATIALARLGAEQ